MDGSGQNRTNVDEIGLMQNEWNELDRIELNGPNWIEQNFSGQNGLNKTEEDKMD